MPRAARPRKAYRPRPVAPIVLRPPTPIDDEIRAALILPAYSSLQVLQMSGNAQALYSARHTLAATMDVCGIAMEGRGIDVGPIEAGVLALRSMVDRHARTGAWRASGPELEAMRAAIRHIDGHLNELWAGDIGRAVERAKREHAEG